VNLKSFDRCSTLKQSKIQESSHSHIRFQPLNFLFQGILIFRRQISSELARFKSDFEFQVLNTPHALQSASQDLPLTDLTQFMKDPLQVQKRPKRRGREKCANNRFDLTLQHATSEAAIQLWLGK
jgi:hypothetical protein